MAKHLNITSCKLISASGELFGDVQLAEAKKLQTAQCLTAVTVVTMEDPFLQMLGFLDGKVIKNHDELRRMALVTAEKLLKATCSLLYPDTGAAARRRRCEKLVKFFGRSSSSSL